MFCEAYRETLKDAAAAGSAMGPRARLHLAACEACTIAFAEEQALFAAMDSGLSKLVNAGARPSLLPRVREAIAGERIPPRRTFLNWGWIPTAAVATMMLAAFLPRAFHRSQPENVPVIVVQPSAAPAGTVGTTENPPSPRPNNPRSSAPVRRPAEPVTTAHSASAPEIIVSPQEEAALASYVALLQKRADLAQALLDLGSKKSTIIEPLVIAEIDSTELKIEPLVKDSDDATK